MIYFAATQASKLLIRNLKAHMLVHSGVKPFVCKKCSFSCTQAGDLKKISCIFQGALITLIKIDRLLDTVNNSINLILTRDTVDEKGGVAPHQKEGESLEEVAYLSFLLLTAVASKHHT